ncbi:MAG: VWA domain-containing protein [Deltaproteobacteria bacterium]|nr:VWA domain-containing protein [Deltaproteobacteria bacterium]
MSPFLRWRLVLGEAAGDVLDGVAEMTARDLARDAALAWLYDRDETLVLRDVRPSGGASRSPLSVPEWVNEVHRLFPKETVDILIREAVEDFGLTEVVTDPEVLSTLEPNETLLRAILLTKNLMNPEVLDLAREIVRKVVRMLIERLSQQMRQAFSGSLLRRRTKHKTMRNFDARGTIQKNISRYDAQARKIYIEHPLFWSSQRKHRARWQVIVLVDQSGSMVESVIYAAVMASCFWTMPAIKSHLVAFDVDVVDLTVHVSDPVETLMKVQLGGGTDIARALRYAESLVENPRRTIVVLISDLFEGGDSDALLQSVRRLCQQEVKFLALGALDRNADPSYDRILGQRLAQEGAHVGAMTPEVLLEFLAKTLR